MSYEYSEDGMVEEATKDVLIELGWEVVTAWKKETFGKDGLLGRENRSEVILTRELSHALVTLNPGLPDTAYQQAIDIITQKTADKTLGKINQEKYKLLKDGVPVKFTNSDNELEERDLKVFDYQDYSNNSFLAVSQLEVVGDLYNRRPDIVGFVNGIPLVFFELKAHHQDLRHAYDDNFTDYKDTIPAIFHCNGFVILSNGTESKVGTVTSPYKYFLDWKRIEEDAEGVVSLDTMIRGTCDPKRLMDIFENFLLFDTSYGEVVKLMAKNHQYIGVNKVIDQVDNIEDLQGKLGVFWHTQGSGKSYSMVFLCEKIHRKMGGSYTFLLVVDRSELESQIYDTFSGVGVVNKKELIAGKKSGMTGREHLRELLSENHRYIFTLIHKFSIDPNKESEYPLITNRKNVIVISDEAHRTQGGTYARNMRFYGLPNASYLGFTGTPIIKDEEELTKDIFGDYVSVYDFKRAVEDGATLPLRYLNKGELLNIDNPKLDEEMAEVLENEDLTEDQRQKLIHKFSRNYPILTAQSRLETIAKDLVWHFNERGYQGKAMLVALDKPTAVRMYDLIKRYWGEYLIELQKRIDNAEDVQEAQELGRKFNRVTETEVCVVVSGEQNEVDKFKKLGLDVATHRKKMVERDLEKEFKDPDNPFRLAIVCAMWITGFDAQCVSTVYLDKPIKGHTLMQTIARANRVYDDEKENGLIVDYGNVYEQLEKAYSVYGEGGTGGGGKGTGPEKPIPELSELEVELKIAIEETIKHLGSLGFDLESLKNASPMLRISKLQEAENCVCLNETSRATFEVMAQNVFRKYKALFPEPQAKSHTKDHNAIEAIYKQLNKKAKSADITEVMKKLQSLVSDSISVKQSHNVDGVYIDLSNLDFDKLKAAFAKSDQKNTMTYTLQQIIENKLEQMLKENPLRIEFYERYKEIIDAYNAGKSLENTVKAFDDLNDFVRDLSVEEQRAVRENLGDQEVLAIFDLLTKGKELNNEDVKKVKKVAKDTLDKLKVEKLSIERWRESREVIAQVKIVIHENMLHLPIESYSDEDVDTKATDVYQHIFASYRGGNDSVYRMSA
ncbi:type I restriction endonuclease subunit R [Psychrobacter cryohalolentis]|uniref:Type I restriction enzyme endonuclease subunit n=1 Tax=Psychrobacter cryohalolentis (strain ATCC BAA-1226 / DSM 17306 / VKM B-2378 / K5) TaxID=335284 RepID=Q1Q863_PSYCK|nr:type I restriction endonuclease subunit R [Psychrobacter cryohalolentis]ABE76140.1 type I site-specific deoxyribonuclease, HsdR family [Psychrobacter cryohalolentis K5]ASE26317.1 type I restriction endonuclease subunit R [Psychrobacter cryohalolentis]|tara:strand:+ start:14290 stop:17493 length:3204 start_codon:yes stop_codon:yes gene_type:complete